MPNTISDLIKDTVKDLPQVIKETLISGESLTEQVVKLITKDAKSLQRLGEDFVIPEEKDLEPHLKIKFNSFLAESLLREGSLLLDRCLQQRREYHELATKWFEAKVQIDEFIKLNEITVDDEKTYGLPIQAENYNRLAAEKEKIAYKNSSEKSKESQKYINDNKTELQNLASKAAWASLLYRELDAGGIATHWAGGGPIDDKWKGINDSDIPCYRTFDNAFFSSNYEQNLRLLSLKDTVQRSDDNVGVIEEKLKASQIFIDYMTSQKDFKIRRNDVARFVAKRRLEAFIEENGALNYAEQMKPLELRFTNDLWSAWLRLSAAAEGFQMLYSYDSAKINSNLFKKRLDDPKKLQVYDRNITFDDLVTWCQLTNTWLASFLDTQQQVTRSFSLRKLINDDAVFEAGKKVSTWRFKLKESDFTNMKFVRMRSFAVQIDSGNNSGSWNVSITPPAKAKNEPKEQGHIGTLYLGRVNERIYAVISEGSAPPKLFNASPIGEDSPSGEWAISVIGNGSTSRAKIEDIQDIDIHLTVALV